MKITSATLTAVTPDGYPVEIPVQLDDGERITEAIAKVTAILADGGWDPPPTPPIAETTGSYPGEKMLCTVHEGKAYWSVTGGEFRKFGLSIWPEVLIDAGFNPDQMNPLQPIDLKGYTAHYITKNGKPKKVVKLEKS